MMSHRGKFMSSLFEQLAIVKEELRKLEEMMHGNMLQLPWDKAPEWAQWAAMDLDGEWCWFSKEPVLDATGSSNDMWYITKEPKDTIVLSTSFDFPPCTNWKESKRKRP